MEDQPGEVRSELYLLRVWVAPGPGNATGYRGKLQPVLGDDSYCFSGAAELLALLASVLLGGVTITGTGPGPEAPGPPETPES